MVRRSSISKRNNNKPVIYGLLIIGVLLVGMMAASTSMFGAYTISSYGGMVAEITDASIPKMGSEDVNWEEISIEGTIAYVDRTQMDGPTDWTKISCELTGDVSEGEKDLLERFDRITDNGDGTETIEYIDVYEVSLDFHVVVKTVAGSGLFALEDITFEITVSENRFDIFTDEDDVVAYILRVYTIGDTTSNYEGLSDGTPAIGGFSFATFDNVVGEEIEWTDLVGLEGQAVNRFVERTFSIDVNRIEPFWEWGRRSETYLDWHIGVDILTLGYWSETGDNLEYTPPEDPLKPGFWEQLFILLQEGGEGLMILIIIIVAGIVIIKTVGGRKQQQVQIVAPRRVNSGYR